MPQRDLDNYGYREKTSTSEKGSHGSDREYHLSDPKEMTFKTSNETNRLIGELSAKPLDKLIEEHEQDFEKSIFSRDSYTDVERTSVFAGFNLSLKVVGGVGLKFGFVFDNFANRLGFKVCVDGSFGMQVGFKVFEVSPESGGVPDDVKITAEAQTEAFRALGLGLSNSGNHLGGVLGLGVGDGVSGSICLTERVRFEKVKPELLRIP